MRSGTNWPRSENAHCMSRAGKKSILLVGSAPSQIRYENIGLRIARMLLRSGGMRDVTSKLARGRPIERELKRASRGSQDCTQELFASLVTRLRRPDALPTAIHSPPLRTWN